MLAGLRHNVCHQALRSTWVIPRHYNRLSYTGSLFERRFYLSQLDSETSNLDLVIAPSKKLDIPTRQISSQISGCVKFCPWTKRTRNEIFRVQFRPIQVTSGEAIASDIE